jgi:hypothetical protein
MIREFNSEADSSTIHSASHNDETLDMLVHFKSSFATISYAYKNVPVEVFEEFETSDSKGTAFRDLFYNKYEFVKLNHTTVGTDTTDGTL